MINSLIKGPGNHGVLKEDPVAESLLGRHMPPRSEPGNEEEKKYGHEVCSSQSWVTWDIKEHIVDERSEQ